MLRIEDGGADDARPRHGRGNRSDFAFGTREGWDAFRVVRWHGIEQLSRPFSYELTLTRDVALGPADIQGLVDASVTFAIVGQQGVRAVHGIVGAAEELDRTRRLHLYRVELVPHLVRARHRSGCRSFRKRGVKDAVSRLLEHLTGTGGLVASAEGTTARGGVDLRAFVEPTAAYRWSLTEPESARLTDPEYRSTIIQYNESDFELLSRLLEEEGLTYWFEHGAAGSTMVISDRAGAVPAYGVTRRIEHRSDRGGAARAQNEHVHTYRQRYDLRPRAARVVDHDRMVPRMRREARADGVAMQATGDNARFACPGGAAYCDLFSRLAMERHEAQRSLASGAGDVRWLEPGVRGVLRDVDAVHDDRDVVFERVETFAQELLPEGTVLDHEPFGFDDAAAREPFYENRFRSVSAAVRYRPELTVAKPRMGGIHRAIITSEEGAQANPEINTNANGDVRLRFAWDDREPEAGIASSQWIPVVNYWGGTGWGTVQTPRVGQTVYVAFHDGDVDQPVVLGGYYSTQTPLPYDPSKSPTVSGFRTQSSPGGGNFNEMRFDDAAGNEVLSTNAAKDASHTVGNNYDEAVCQDKKQSVGRDRTSAVGGSQATGVKGSDHVNVVGDRALTVGGTCVTTAPVISSFATDYSVYSGDVEISAKNKITLATGGASLVLDGASATLKADALVNVEAALVMVHGLVVHIVGDCALRLVGGGSSIDLTAGQIRQIAAIIHLNPD